MVINNRKQIRLGEKWVDWDESFRLYMISRDTELTAGDWVGVVNFRVTKSGLEAKLLSIIINTEKPDIEEKRSRCLQQEEGLKMRISDLEKSLLD